MLWAALAIGILAWFAACLLIARMCDFNNRTPAQRPRPFRPAQANWPSGTRANARSPAASLNVSFHDCGDSQ